MVVLHIWGWKRWLFFISEDANYGSSLYLRMRTMVELHIWGRERWLFFISEDKNDGCSLYLRMRTMVILYSHLIQTFRTVLRVPTKPVHFAAPRWRISSLIWCDGLLLDDGTPLRCLLWIVLIGLIVQWCLHQGTRQGSLNSRRIACDQCGH